jgi:hypothetical protein
MNANTCKNIIINKQQYYNNSLFDLYLTKSQIENAGLGVWTRDFIPKNTFVDEYTGIIGNRNFGSDYTLEITKNYYIDAEPFPRCFMAMINDCSYVAKKTIRRKKKVIDITPVANYNSSGIPLEVNCIFMIDIENKKGLIYSTRDIERNTELFISYGKNYWN